jgi:hypothetical protein
VYDCSPYGDYVYLAMGDRGNKYPREVRSPISFVGYANGRDFARYANGKEFFGYANGKEFLPYANVAPTWNRSPNTKPYVMGCAGVQAHLSHTKPYPLVDSPFPSASSIGLTPISFSCCSTMALRSTPALRSSINAATKSALPT